MWPIRLVLLVVLINTVNMEAQNKPLERAILGGGCFWCLEAIFDRVEGVTKVVSGYAGGHVANPTYEQVCTGTTGHAEVVQVDFDPKVITYGELLAVFFEVHDPTTLNRQGGDVGTQYRSVVFFANSVQEAEARRLIAEIELSGKLDAPVVTEVLPLQPFYAAEKYHQDYFALNPNQSYCRLVVAPKVEKFMKSRK